MPVKVTNPLHLIQNLRVEYHNGPFLSMTPGHSTAFVICVSRAGPVGLEELTLSEPQLETLYRGGCLEGEGYTLRGVTNAQMAAAPQFQGFEMAPPACVQVWGMSSDGFGQFTLYVPEDPQQQCVHVPVYYCVERSDSGMCIRLTSSEGYTDGDLMYRIETHLPIPIPASELEREIPLRPGAQPFVEPRAECREQYVLKQA